MWKNFWQHTQREGAIRTILLSFFLFLLQVFMGPWVSFCHFLGTFRSPFSLRSETEGILHSFSSYSLSFSQLLSPERTTYCERWDLLQAQLSFENPPVHLWSMKCRLEWRGRKRKIPKIERKKKRGKRKGKKRKNEDDLRRILLVTRDSRLSFGQEGRFFIRFSLDFH